MIETDLFALKMDVNKVNNSRFSAIETIEANKIRGDAF